MDSNSKKDIIRKFYYNQCNVEIENNVLEYYCNILKIKILILKFINLVE